MLKEKSSFRIEFVSLLTFTHVIEQVNIIANAHWMDNDKNFFVKKWMYMSERLIVDKWVDVWLTVNVIQSSQQDLA